MKMIANWIRSLFWDYDWALDKILREHTTYLVGKSYGGGGGRRLDLSKAGLKGANFSGSYLGEADFTDCRFKKTDFRNSSFIEKCLFDNSEIDDGSFWRTHVRRGNFKEAKFLQSDLSTAALRKCRYPGIHASNREAEELESVKRKAKLLWHKVTEGPGPHPLQSDVVMFLNDIGVRRPSEQNNRNSLSNTIESSQRP